MATTQLDGELAAVVIRIAQRVFTRANRLFILPDDPVFVELIVEALLDLPEGERSELVIERRIKNVYCQLLYAAFLTDGSEEQGRAWAAAQAHILPRLSYRLQDEQLAEGLTQNALTTVWNTLRTKPMVDGRAFISYLTMAAVRIMLRHLGPNAKPDPALGSEGAKPAPLPSRLDGGEIELIDDVAAVDSTPRLPEDEVMQSDLARHVRDAVRRCLRDRPLLLRLIEAHMLEGKSYLELTREWQVPAHQLAQQKFRALEALAKCPEVQALR